IACLEDPIGKYPASRTPTSVQSASVSDAATLLDGATAYSAPAAASTEPFPCASFLSRTAL
ncbi:hypothetical protein RJZ90_007946, partial [Blastomyces dermatitidis]